MEWSAYVRALTEGLTQHEVARRTKVNQSTINRWREGKSTPDAANAARFARDFGRSPLDAFVALGLLTREEADMPPAPENFDLVVADDDRLTEEAKAHLVAQYQLLRNASEYVRQRRDAEAPDHPARTELTDREVDAILSRSDEITDEG